LLINISTLEKRELQKAQDLERGEHDRVALDELVRTKVALDKRVTGLESELAGNKATSVSLVARLQQSLDEMGAEKMSLEDQIADLMKQVEADYNLFIFLIDDMVLNNYMGIFM
jgi:hypothetical protein